jgi:hypothetical protein
MESDGGSSPESSDKHLWLQTKTSWKEWFDEECEKVKEFDKEALIENHHSGRDARIQDSFSIPQVTE